MNIDPCMGSGHILVYAFDVLMQIYESLGVSPRDAAKLILEKNIYGLDIDRRAYQLAYFSLMMKARQYNSRIFTENVKLQVYHPAGWSDGEEYGSLVRVDKLEPMPERPKEQQLTLFDGSFDAKLNAWHFRRLLSQKYDVVVTNPPYIGNNNIGGRLSGYIQQHYDIFMHDLYCVMIERCRQLTKPQGFQAMITQQSFMFNSRYEKARLAILNSTRIINLLHFGAGAFDEISGEVVQTCSFILSSTKAPKYLSAFFDLQSYSSEAEMCSAYLNGIHNCNSSDIYRREADLFLNIEGGNMAYWLSDKMLNLLATEKSLSMFADTRHGLVSGDGSKFMRYWYEVCYQKIGLNIAKNDVQTRNAYKWFPYNKGGLFRRWFGNMEYVVNWENDGYEIRNFKDSKTGKIKSSNYNNDYNYKELISWTDLTTGAFSARYSGEGTLFDTSGPSMFCNSDTLLLILAFANSIVMQNFISLFCTGLHYSPGSVGKVPMIIPSNTPTQGLTKENVRLARTDWDSFETSWDFKRHPLICGEKTVASSFAKWECETAERFNTLKANEEELNRIFIDIYGLQDELTPEVEDKDVTVRRADLGRDIRSLISYAVGCMFGRYSMDVEGLAYAGGDWDVSKYTTFTTDKDNILPICDDEYFDDDVLGRFVVFIRVVYGADTLEENLKFIADALGGKGTSREVIRNYFLNEFYKDHCKIYQKRPIYWLFDSGNKNGFKALIYMHRYSRDLLAKLRTDYVHEQQERYRTQLSHIVAALNSAAGTERARLLKQQDKLNEQLKEVTVFEEKIHHLADQSIDIDLDDGVKKNYEIFADVLAKM